jgi:hypothetical protein
MADLVEGRAKVISWARHGNAHTSEATNPNAQDNHIAVDDNRAPVPFDTTPPKKRARWMREFSD